MYLQARLGPEQEPAPTRKISLSVLQTLSPMEHQCVNMDRSCILSAEHCASLRTSGSLLPMSQCWKKWSGDSPPPWSEKQQDRGCDTFGMWGCPPVLTSIPLAPQHISYSHCLRQWEPPTRSRLLRVWVLLLGAASCPCHSPDLPCPHWMGLTTRPSWDMGTCCVLARGMVGDAA